MSIEREVLVSVLKLTGEGSAQVEDISMETRIPFEIVQESQSRATGQLPQNRFTQRHYVSRRIPALKQGVLHA